MQRLIASILTLLPALLAVATPALAQRRDVRLSPPEPVTYSLAAAIRVHSVASIEGVVLVAWGSDRRDPDSVVQNVIVVQLVRDGRANGVPVAVHSDRGRPTGAVHALALGDRFVVAWNDQRQEGPGLYCATIDTDGALSSEQRLGPLAATMESIGAGSNRALVWSSLAPASPAVYVQRFDDEGSAGDRTDSLAGSIRRLVRLDDVLEGSLVQTDSAGWRFIGPDGKIDSRLPVAIPRSEPWHVRSDGGLVALIGDTVVRFSSLFDTSRAVIGMLARDGIVAGSEVLTIDSTGSVVIVATRQESTLMSDRFEVLQWRLSPLAITTMVAYDFDGKLDPHYRDHARVEKVERWKGCSNTLVVKVNLATWKDLPNSNGSFIIGYSADPRGGLLLTASLPTLDCASSSRLHSRRLTADTTSSIEIVVGADTAVVGAPTTWKQLSVPQTRPGLVVDTGWVGVTWIRPAQPGPCCSPENYYTLVAWPDPDDTVGTAPREVTVPLFASGPAVQDYRRSEWIDACDGFVAVTALHTARTPNRDPRVYNDKSGEISTYVATKGGWKGGMRARYAVDGMSTGFGITPTTGSFDPNTQTYVDAFILRLADRPDPVDNVSTIDRNGTAQGSDTLKLPAANPGVIIRGIDGEFLLASQDSLRRLTRGAAVPLMALTRHAGPTRVTRLLGRTVLRSWVDSLDRTMLTLELYDLELGLIRSRILRSSRTIRSYAITQSGSDRSIFVLYTDDGVRVNRYTPELRSLWEEIAASVTRDTVGYIAAAVRGDTLLLVWEDLRAGLDIYGTALDIASIPSHVESPGRTRVALLESVTPQPATDHLAIVLAAAQPDVIVMELYALDGTRRAAVSLEPGRVGAEMAVGGLDSGVYLLVVRSGERVEHRRVVVVR